MRSYIQKAFSVLLSLLLLMNALAFPLSAIDFKKGTNNVSESYKSGVYYENLSAVPHTGDGRTDVLAVALSQLGYTEGDENGQFSGTVAGSANYTEYNYNMGSFGSGYGGKDYPWCASFVAFCLLQAGCHSQTKISDWCRNNEGDPEYIWREISCNKWATQLRAFGHFEDSIAFGGNYEPIAGDLIFFTTNNTWETHIGFVLYSDGSKVYTVEGNTSSAQGLETNGGGVYAKSYDLSSSYIRGYGILPYEVDNSVCKIDYSGTKATAGLYVATTSKYVYMSEYASTYSYILPKYSLFTVTQAAENGRLKVICKIGGNTITGYVKNNSDRVIQISSDEKREGYSPITEAWGYKGHGIDGYFINSASSASSEKPDVAELTFEDTLGISGWAGFTRKIATVGYYFDSNYENVVFEDGALTATDAFVISRGGKNAQSFCVCADPSALAAGKHTVSFVIKLADGTVTTADTLDFILRKENETVPEPPTVESFTSNSVTLTKLEGYEYSLSDGMWQTSNVFEWLDASEGITYSFSQRIAKTDTELASVGSDPLTVELKKLLDANKLTSLEISGVTLFPAFDPDVTEYSANVPHNVTQLEPTASAAEGAAIDIVSPPLAEGDTTQIKITVTPTIGEARVYTVNVTREGNPVTEDTTQVSDTQAPESTDLPTTETTEATETETEIHTDFIEVEPEESQSQATTTASCSSRSNSTVMILMIMIISLTACGTKRIRKKL